MALPPRGGREERRDQLLGATTPTGRAARRTRPASKNVVGLLTEVASCRIATPVTWIRTSCRAGARGSPTTGQQSNFPNPWPGGWWRLRDIVDYERIAGNALLETCATYREEILANFVRHGAATAIRSGANEAPYAYVIPPIDSARSRPRPPARRGAARERPPGEAREDRADDAGRPPLPGAERRVPRGPAVSPLPDRDDGAPALSRGAPGARHEGDPQALRRDRLDAAAPDGRRLGARGPAAAGESSSRLPAPRAPARCRRRARIRS